jgi:hypothetical protein
MTRDAVVHSVARVYQHTFGIGTAFFANARSYEAHFRTVLENSITPESLQSLPPHTNTPPQS